MSIFSDLADNDLDKEYSTVLPRLLQCGSLSYIPTGKLGRNDKNVTELRHMVSFSDESTSDKVEMDKNFLNFFKRNN